MKGIQAQAAKKERGTLLENPKRFCFAELLFRELHVLGEPQELEILRNPQ